MDTVNGVVNGVEGHVLGGHRNRIDDEIVATVNQIAALNVHMANLTLRLVQLQAQRLPLERIGDGLRGLGNRVTNGLGQVANGVRSAASYTADLISLSSG